MRIAHFLSDSKFVDEHINKYIESDFINDYFYLKREYNYTGINRDIVNFLPPESEEYTDIINNIEKYDIVILYYLNPDKSRFIEAIKHSNVKIIWSFYGVEIYGLSSFREKVLSEITLNALKKIDNKLDVAKIKVLIVRFINKFRKKKPKVQWIQKSCERIDYFLWYNKFEYDFLNEQLGNILPPFIQAPLNISMEDVVPNKDKQNSILIGNSAAYYNNHLDALAILKANNFDGTISLPFSYGKNLGYEAYVKKYLAQLGLKINLIETFVGYEDYIKFVNSHAAAVYPSFRQMGLGNIFIAVRCGLKVYLSEKNPTLYWLRDKGMKIYSIEQDFEKDLINYNLKLDLAYIELNNAIYTTMVGKKNNLVLFEEFYTISK